MTMIQLISRSQKDELKEISLDESPYSVSFARHY